MMLNSTRWQTALPKDLLDQIHSHSPLKDSASIEEVVDWLMTREALVGYAAQRYLSYFKLMFETFSGIARMFDLQSPAGSHHTKSSLRQINVPELMYMAHHLYVLDSFGVGGDVLECGCFQGFSTCCLSHACDWLGRQLFVADSFQGLPSPAAHEATFSEGDFSASRKRVEQNLKCMGKPACATFIEGWFDTSLRGWSRPLAILWIDADLYSSTKDLLKNVFPSLSRKGAVFAHEFTDGEGVAYPVGSQTVPGAVFEAFADRGGKHRSAVLEKYFGTVGFESSVQFDSWGVVSLLMQKVLRMDERWELYHELKSSRTVEMAFRIKRLFHRS